LLSEPASAKRNQNATHAVPNSANHPRPSQCSNRRDQ
jgi:hypothetical protein